MRRTQYTGGKGNVFQTLINLIPPHSVYIEAFAGAGAILKNKRPAARSVVIDRDRRALEICRQHAPANTLLIEGDAREILPALRLPADSFIFIDPPYLQSVRRSRHNLYKYELKTDEEHADLLDIIAALPFRCLITHYDAPLYRERLRDWQQQEFITYDRGNNANKEIAFFNYEPPAILHDYRHLGRNFRERERITRQQKRWRARLLRMSLTERQAMFSVIESAFSIAENGDTCRQPSPESARRPALSPQIAMAAEIAENSDNGRHRQKRRDEIQRSIKEKTK